MVDLNTYVRTDTNLRFTGARTDEMAKVVSNLVPTEEVVCVPDVEHVERWQHLFPKNILMPVLSSGTSTKGSVLLTDEAEEVAQLCRRYSWGKSVWCLQESEYKSGRCAELKGYHARISICSGKVMGVTRRIAHAT